MNFARAVKGVLTRSRAVKEIDSQLELELGRPMTKTEEANLYERFPPYILLDRMEKVCSLNHFILFSSIQIF